MVNNLHGTFIDGDGRPFPINAPYRRRRVTTPEPDNGTWLVVEYPVTETDLPGRDLQLVHRDDRAAAAVDCDPPHEHKEQWFRYEPEDCAPPCPESWQDITAGASAVYALDRLGRLPYRTAQNAILLREIGRVAYLTGAVLVTVVAVVAGVGIVVNLLPILGTVLRSPLGWGLAGGVVAAGLVCRRRQP